MGLFDETRGSLPSTVLARHLFAKADNELIDVLPALATADVSKGLERINGTDRHRALLLEAFNTASRSLLVSSPFLSEGAIEADQVLDLIRAARARQVEVVINTGMKHSRGEDDQLDRVRQSLAAAGARVLRQFDPVPGVVALELLRAQIPGAEWSRQLLQILDEGWPYPGQCGLARGDRHALVGQASR